jgi:hypothetical protein
VLNTWNVVAFFIKKLNVESNDNVKNHLQTHAKLAELVDFKNKIRHSLG